MDPLGNTCILLNLEKPSPYIYIYVNKYLYIYIYICQKSLRRGIASPSRFADHARALQLLAAAREDVAFQTARSCHEVGFSAKSIAEERMRMHICVTKTM